MMQTRSYSLLALTIIFFTGLPFDICASEKNIPGRFIEQIKVPGSLTRIAGKKIVVAVVDDGIKITHEDLQDFIWQNPFEIPGNSIDDDGNGMVDDVNGWDVSDNNPAVSPPRSRLLQYYHGTHLAGVIVQIVRAAYGPAAAESLAIMPVKALADEADNTAIRHGYQGIEYAVRAGADIILCAWSVAHITEDEKQILRNAHDKGVLVVGSVGNFPEEREMFPAAEQSVLAVASLDKDNTLSTKSNYGSFVDLSAPGEDIYSASTRTDDFRTTHDGTSLAAAIAAGAAAVMKISAPSSSNTLIKACLKNSSTLLDISSTTYSAKQGAGLVNIKEAVACLTTEPVQAPTPFHPQGYLDLSAGQSETKTWIITPPGEFKGIWFARPEGKGKIVQAFVDFYAGSADAGKPLASFPVSSMPEKFFVAGTRAAVTVRGLQDMQPHANLLMEYRAEAIDFRTIHCSGTEYLYEEGKITDGSGSEPYSVNSDCKWQITAPEGKVVHFKFNSMDTEPRTDLIYFFNGTGTHEHIMAIFSGTDIPPELTTWSNKVLVWFVTNGTVQGEGWKAEYTFVDDLSGSPTQ